VLLSLYRLSRPSKALELTPGRILIEEKALVFRSLKKRKLDSRGRVKQPQYRTVPVPEMLIENLDLVYGIRALQKKDKGLDIPLWTMSRLTAYRLVKRAMDRVGIVGKQATGKGIRPSAWSRQKSRCQSTYYLSSRATPTPKPRKYISRWWEKRSGRW